MQENDFERAIRDKLNGLQLAPSDEVWNKVAANIQASKKKRRFIFLFLIATTVAALGGLYLYYSLNDKPASKSQPALLTQQGRLSTEPNRLRKSRVDLDTTYGRASAANTLKRTVEQRSSLIKSNNSVGNSQTGMNKNVPLTSYKQKPAFVAKGPRYKGSVLIPTHYQKPYLKKQSITIASSINTNLPSNDRSQIRNNSIKSQEILNATDTVNGYDYAKDTTSEGAHVPIENVKVVNKDTIEVSPEIKILKNQSLVNKKWSIGFTVLAGVSDNHSRIQSAPVLGQANANSPNPSTGAFNNAPAIALDYTTGFSYGVGVYLKKFFNRKMGLTIGLQYHYFSAASRVGNKNISSQTFYDASLRSSVATNQSYGYGQSIKYINGYHFLQLPVNFLLQLNNALKKPILITAGISPAYLLYSNALYASGSQNSYYVTADQFKKCNVTAQAGFQLQLINATHFNVTVGPHLQYGLTNMSKKIAGTNQHLVSALIKFDVTLK